MLTKSIRVDNEVIEELRKRADGKRPNEVLREILELPERKQTRSKLPGDAISRAKRYMLKAIHELDKAGAK